MKALMPYLQKYEFRKKTINIKIFNMIPKKNQAITMTKDFHMIANADSIIQPVIQIKHRIMKHVNVNLKIIIHG